MNPSPTHPPLDHLTQRSATLERLARLNQCFLSFGLDPDLNISNLARVCGELLQADAVLYHRIQAAQGTPPGAGVFWLRATPDSPGKPEPPLNDLLCSEWLPGRICYDVLHRSQPAGDDQATPPNLLAGATFYIPDIQASQYQATDPYASRFGLRTYVGRAVMIGSQPAGVFSALYTRHLDFGPEDDELFTTITVAVSVEEQRRMALLEVNRIKDHLAEAVEHRTSELELARSRLEQEVAGHRQTEAALRRKTLQQAALIEAARHMVSSLDPTHIVERIAIAAKEILQGDALTIYLLDKDGQTLLPVYVLDEPYAEQVMSTPLDVKTSFTGKAVQACQAMIFNDMTITDVGVHIPGTPLDADERMIAAPFVIENGDHHQQGKTARVLGVMAHNRLGEPFTEEDLALAQTFADYAALALNNSALHDQLQKEIEERKAAIEALRESQARYRDLFEQASDAILVWDSDGQIIEVNNQACEILGYGDEELLGMRVNQIEYDYQHKINRRRIKKLVLEHQLSFETSLLDRDGRAVPVEVNATYLPHAGKPLIIAIARDLSERKARERERDAVIQLSLSLRPAARRDAMFPIILQQVQQLVGARSIYLALSEPVRPVQPPLTPGSTLTLDSLVDADQNGNGLEESWVRSFAHDVIQQGAVKTYQPRLAEGDVFRIGTPLIAHEHAIGALIVSWAQMPSEGDQRTLAALVEVAASALYRAALHEDTQRQLRRLEALHTIERALTSIMNLETNLKILVEQVIEQLDVDAADIQLFEAPTLNLVYVTGQGFRSSGNPGIPPGSEFSRGLDQVSVYTSEMARQVALERRLVYIPNLLMAELGSQNLTDWVIEENFVSYIGAPLVARGQLMGVLEIFQRARLDPDQEWLNFMDTLARQTAIAIDNASLFEDLQRTHMDLTVAYDKTLEGWARALELRDKETEGHSNRVVELTLRLAREMGIGREELVHVRRGALLHDIGKMGLPDSILSKPGPLDPDEWQMMYQHPNYAHTLLSPIPYLRPALDIPYCHHEKWDGTGYPRGLQGEQIPLSARIFAVVDVFDALRNDRPYRFAWPEEDVRQYLRENAGSHFDPSVVDVFFKLMGWE
jgi:PAS domain S-box-containing protein